MAAPEGILSISMASVLEDVLKQHGSRLSDGDLASRKTVESAARRYEAAGWLRKAVGVVGARDLADEPSEEEFRIGLRNGLILCSALNKIHPGAVPKVVVNPGDSAPGPDGAALSAYQYFENVRNFLVAVRDIGLPTFEASDLEQGGKGARVVNCVLAMKSYGEWKQMGGSGSWKYGGGLKPVGSGKTFFRKNSDPFMGSLSRGEKETVCSEQISNGDNSSESSSQVNSPRNLNMLVRAVLSDKNPDEVPLLVESMLNKVMEELERRLTGQNDMVKSATKGLSDDNGKKSFVKAKVSVASASSCEMKMEIEDCNFNQSKKEEYYRKTLKDETSKDTHRKQLLIIDQQQKDIQEIKRALRTTRAGMQYMQMKYSEEFNNLGKHLFGITHAASSYHKVLEENRKLYNQVQDLKGSIRVYCRVRPFLHGELKSNSVARMDDESITIITPAKYCKEGHRSFNFNKVFGPQATQEEVFSDTQPLIRSVLDGYNVCIFAYGQTGSGKTYTMSGPKELNEQSMGVNYRALSDLFNLSEQRRGIFSYEIAVQMIEIYNEQVRDLLVSDGLNRRLEIRNNSQNGLNVPDANLVSVSSTFDVIELMNIGQKNRSVGATALNDRSSRSHSCLTVHVQGTDMTSGAIFRGCMHLVDLAGSERVDKSEVTGERLKEAQHINKSLSALGDVISALAQKNTHVPYRNSKLTQLLQDSLGGQAKTLMFVHVSPEMESTGETISTLKFAERVSAVELGAARLNKESGEVKELKEQIASLKAALGRKDGEEERVPCSPDIPRIKTGATSNIATSNIGTPNRQNGDSKSYLTAQRQPMEEVGNIEVQRQSALSQKKPSFDLQELLMISDSPPPWLDNAPGLNSRKGEEKETIAGDWVDKHASVIRDNSMGDFEGDGAALPDFFYQRYQSDAGPISNQQSTKSTYRRNPSYDFDMQRTRFDATTTDGSDDFDVATSDSSEPDLLWQFNQPKASPAVNGSGSRIKKPQSRIPLSPDIRTPTGNSHSHLPSPSPSRTLSSHIPSPSRSLSSHIPSPSRKVSTMDRSLSGKTSTADRSLSGKLSGKLPKPSGSFSMKRIISGGKTNAK